MKNVRFLGKLFCLISFSIIAWAHPALAQTNKTESFIEREKAGLPSEGFVLTIKVDKEAISKGMPVVVEVIQKNMTDEDLTLILADPEKDYEFIVEDFSGKPANELRYQQMLRNTGVGVRGRRIFKKMLPGKQVEYKFNLSRRFDMSLPGVYKIQVQTRVLKTKGEDTTLLTSNIETVEIPNLR